MILTMPKLAEALDAAGRQYIADFKDKPVGGMLPAGFLMMSYILQAMGLKVRTESLNVAMDRLIEQRPALDLAYDSDRDTMSLLLKQMFGPLGVEKLLIVGVSGEGRCFITHFSDKPEGLGSVREIKDLMQAIINDPDAEDLNL